MKFSINTAKLITKRYLMPLFFVSICCTSFISLLCGNSTASYIFNNPYQQLGQRDREGTKGLTSSSTLKVINPPSSHNNESHKKAFKYLLRPAHRFLSFRSLAVGLLATNALFLLYSNNYRSWNQGYYKDTSFLSAQNQPREIISDDENTAQHNELTSEKVRCARSADRENEEVQRVKALIEKDADILVPNSIGRTALHDSAIIGYSKCVELLIPLFKKAGLINAQSKYKESLLILAARSGNAANVEGLINAGGDITQLSSSGESALHAACRSGRGDVVKTLIPLFKAHNLLDLQNDKGYHPLMLAIHHGNDEGAKSLLKAGVQRFLNNIYGENTLHEAMYNKHIISALWSLIPIFAEANLLNLPSFYRNETALQIAEKMKNYEATSMLLLFGAYEDGREHSAEIKKRVGEKIARLTLKELQEGWLNTLVSFLLKNAIYKNPRNKDYKGLINLLFKRVQELRSKVNGTLNGQRNLTKFPPELNSLVTDYLIADSHRERQLIKLIAAPQ